MLYLVISNAEGTVMSEPKPGIYLETKKGKLGSGSTSQDTEYRNFWLAVFLGDNQAQLFLLDNDFKPTGFRDMISVSTLETEKYTYVPEGEKRYQLLLEKYGEKLTKPPQEKQKSAAPAEPEKPRGWWESKPKDIKPGDAFKRTPKGKKPEPQSRKGNWWET